MSRGRVGAAVRDARLAVYRAALVDAAEHEFASLGVEAATMRGIATRAGISVGVMYDAFEGKEALLDAVHRSRGEALIARAAAVATAERPLDVLLAGVEVMVRFFDEHPGYLRLQLRNGVAWSHPEFGHGLDGTTWRAGLEMMAEVFRVGREDGSLVDDDPMASARLLMAVQQSCLADWQLARPKPSADDVVERLSSLVVRMFVRRAVDERAHTPRVGAVARARGAKRG